ncbi:MAG: hypothetical protein A3G18_03565 [Rhodospirillales bacterium RIFCSPLOWO2_12_FULL_58_28]|nr:MAG: hypothetical protein A3H92_01055 [Rhodospirillales bacterium RIFCSPLOWO2_02_FULL_58_16]OHC76879.1 MAG: hypothetical protein A3G18_03565 [Rhodospirillales bacterium RIFCSPLOWO2_12_FULL_58_28]
MNRNEYTLRRIFLFMAAALITAMAATGAMAANPCAPVAANPCAAMPGIDSKLVTRPAGTSLFKGDPASLAKEGERLFKDQKLSTNGLSCSSCHEDNKAFMPGFAEPYPHFVAMAAEMGKVKSVHLDEMVQFCMVAPMEAKPLAWESRELAALAAYVGELQKKFQSKVMNPCAKQ